MRQRSPGLLSFVLSRVVLKQGSSTSAMSASASDVEVSFSKMSRETAREVTSICAGARFIFSHDGKERGFYK